MAKNGFISAMDDLPYIVKIILCLPVLDFIWGIYRIVKGYTTKNTFVLVIGILWLVIGTSICWILDIICMIINKQLLFA